MLMRSAALSERIICVAKALLCIKCVIAPICRADSRFPSPGRNRTRCLRENQIHQVGPLKNAAAGKKPASVQEPLRELSFEFPILRL